MKRISIKDIAREAGVVPSTVSAVLNGKSKQMRISDALSEKIRAIATRLGYQPNSTAVSLRTGKTNVIGLIVEDISNTFFATLAKFIQDEAYSMGYKVVFCSTENSDEKGIELIRMLLQSQVDGFLITPTNGMHAEVAKLQALKKPVVFMDRFIEELEKVPYAIVDNYNGVINGMDHLYEKGYNTIAFLSVELEQVQMKQREQAYFNSIAKNKKGPPLLFRIPYDLPTGESVQRIQDFLQANPGIDALFCATNYLGLKGLESIKSLGLSIPNDMAIVCFDDHDIFRLYDPGITSVQQPIESIATTATQLLLKMINKKELEPQEMINLKSASLIVRAST